MVINILLTMIAITTPSKSFFVGPTDTPAVIEVLTSLYMNVMVQNELVKTYFILFFPEVSGAEIWFPCAADKKNHKPKLLAVSEKYKTIFNLPFLKSVFIEHGWKKYKCIRHLLEFIRLCYMY